MTPFAVHTGKVKPKTPRTQAGLGFFVGWETDVMPPDPDPENARARAKADVGRVFRVRLVLGVWNIGMQF